MFGLATKKYKTPSQNDVDVLKANIKALETERLEREAESTRFDDRIANIFSGRQRMVTVEDEQLLREKARKNAARYHELGNLIRAAKNEYLSAKRLLDGSNARKAVESAEKELSEARDKTRVLEQRLSGLQAQSDAFQKSLSGLETDRDTLEATYKSATAQALLDNKKMPSEPKELDKIRSDIEQTQRQYEAVKYEIGIVKPAVDAAVQREKAVAVSDVERQKYAIVDKYNEAVERLLDAEKQFGEDLRTLIPELNVLVTQAQRAGCPMLRRVPNGSC